MVRRSKYHRLNLRFFSLSPLTLCINWVFNVCRFNMSMNLDTIQQQRWRQFTLRYLLVQTQDLKTWILYFRLVDALQLLKTTGHWAMPPLLGSHIFKINF